MNCNCPVPVPAVIRQVKKQGDNFGRHFYTCANGNCKLFTWTTDTPSASAPPSYASKSASGGSYGGNSQAKYSSGRGGGKLIIGISEIEPLPPQRIWFSVMAPADAALTKYYSSLPLHLQKQCPRTRVWTFDFCLYESFIREVKTSSQFAHLEVVELPRFLSQGLPLYQKYLPTSFEEPDLLPKFRETLLPFQLEGLKFVIRHGGRALVADEMGCGKTLTAIAILMHYREELPALVMLPASLARQWKSELLKHASEIFKSEDICLITKSSEIARGKIALVPYSLIDKMADCGHIRPDQFGIVIADEVHNLKNPDAKRTEICLPYLKLAKVAIGLTGTPILNRPKEIFTVLSALLPRIFNNYNEFIVRYCNAKKVPYGKGIDDSGASNTAELYTVLGGIIMVRRLKDDVVTSLPPKKREIKYITPDPKYIHQLRTIKSEMESLKKQMEASVGIDDSITAKLRSQEQQQINRYKQVTGLSKVFSICNIVREMVRRLKARGEAGVNLTQTMGDSVAGNPNSATLAPMITDLTTTENFGRLEKDILTDVFDADSEVEVLTDPFPNRPTPKKETFVADDDDMAICDSDEDIIKKTRCSQRSLNRLKPSANAKEYSDREENIGAADGFGRVLRSAKKGKSSGLASLIDHASGSDGDDLFFLEPTVSKKENAGHKTSRLDDFESAESSSSDEGFMFGGRADDEEYIDDNVKREVASEEWKKLLGGTKGRRDAKGAETKKRKTGFAEKSPVLSRKNRLPEKFIIFAHHREVMDLIEDCLREIEVDYVRLDGSSSNSTRNETVMDFQERDLADVALLALKACGTGLNLTAASTAIFAELDWSPATMFQAEDRIHRIGQKAPVVKIILTIAEESADLIVWEILQKKHGIVDATVGASDKGSRISIALHNREATTGQTTLNFMPSGFSQPSISQSFSERSAAGTEEKSSSREFNIKKDSPVRAESSQLREKSNVSGIAKYLIEPPPASSVYGGKPKPSADSKPSAGVYTSHSNIISLVDEKFNEIPLDLIEQQFRLADEMAAKKRKRSDFEKGKESEVHADLRIGEKMLNSAISSNQQSNKLLLPQSIDVEHSQFEYPASQTSIADGNKPSVQAIQRSPTKPPAMINGGYNMPVTETLNSAKPKLGWSLAPIPNNFEEKTPRQSPTSIQQKSGLPEYSSSSQSNLSPKRNLNMNPPVQNNTATVPARNMPTKVLDEATRLRIEENKKKAQLLLQQRKLAAAGGGSGVSGSNFSAVAPVATLPKVAEKSVAKVSPVDEATDGVINSKVSRAAYVFETGKGRTVPVSEEALRNINSSRVLSVSSNEIFRPAQNGPMEIKSTSRLIATACDYQPNPNYCQYGGTASAARPSSSSDSSMIKAHQRSID